MTRVDQVEQEYDAWCREQSVSISDNDRAEILTLGEELPRLWHAATTRSADRKQIVRLVIKDVALDQKRRRGYVWIKVIWQTGAASEHWLQRCVQGYEQHADQDRLRQCITELNRQQKMDGEIAAILNKEALRTAHGASFSGGMVHVLRKRWRIQSVKINGTAANPPQWPDGSYSVQGAAAAIGIAPQVIFDWLRKGWLTGTQLAKGMPWQISLSPDQAAVLRARVRTHQPVVAGDQHAAAFIATRDKLEEEMRCVWLERQVSQLVDDQQLGLGKEGEPLLQPALGMHLGQMRHERRRGNEQHRIAGQDRLAPDGDGEMGLPDARRDSDMAPGFWRMKRSGSSTLFIHWRAESSPPLDAASCLAAKRI